MAPLGPVLLPAAQGSGTAPLVGEVEEGGLLGHPLCSAGVFAPTRSMPFADQRTVHLRDMTWSRIRIMSSHMLPGIR